MYKAAFGLLVLVACGHAFIVPQEVPSILSLVYSNVPPIKKGTDSRFGFGYRLGEHADFQVVYELGPQKYTRKLGSQDSDSNNNKRNADYDESYKASPNSAGAKWLSNWSNGMKSQKKRMPQKDVQANGVQEVKTMPYINESALKQLQLLYGKPQTASEDIGVIPAEQLEQDFKIVMEEPKVDKAKITADLMDVDLD